MSVYQQILRVNTPGPGFVDITQQVAMVAEQGGTNTGLCTLFIRHTSASLIIQENADPAVLRDLSRWMDELVPQSRAWEHDDEGPDDMPAHVRSVLTKTSASIPLAEGRLLLGQWQGIFVWEHRARPHQRTVVVTISGSAA